MNGPFDGHGIALGRMEDEELYGDPYVQLLLRHLKDPDLFRGTPEETRARQEELLVPFLDFFLRHDKDGYYESLFRRKGLLDESGPQPKVRSDVVLEDLVQLRIHSDDLRGDGQQKRLIREIDPHHPPAGSMVFRSSGTTGNTAGPVTILRSPMALHIERLVNGEHIEWSFGRPIKSGCCMLQMAPEMTDFMAYASLMADLMRLRGCEIIFGNRLREDPNEPNVWRRLEPDRAAMMQFFTSNSRSKYLVTGSAGLFATVANPDPKARLAIKLSMGVPPIELGEDGFLMTAGGLKRVPTQYTTMREFMAAMADHIVVNRDGQKLRAPLLDAFGLTESLAIFINRAGDPLDDQTWIKYPHPLTYVALLESPQSLTPVPNDEFGKSRLLFYVNFTCVDYLEAVVPGDFVIRVRTPSCYHHGLIYDRRASTSEGFQIREGCG